LRWLAGRCKDKVMQNGPGVHVEAREGLEVPQFIFHLAVPDRVQNGYLRLATTVDG
jgi:hypothetical protein